MQRKIFFFGGGGGGGNFGKAPQVGREVIKCFLYARGIKFYKHYVLSFKLNNLEIPTFLSQEFVVWEYDCYVFRNKS